MTIHDVSERGMMLRGERVPQSGSIIEIRIGDASIVAEVRWSEDGRCGVRIRERIDVQALLNSRALRSVERNGPNAAPSAQVRNVRPEELAARHRFQGRLIEYVLVVAFVILGAVMLVSAVAEFLGRPLGQVQSRLNKPS